MIRRFTSYMSDAIASSARPAKIRRLSQSLTSVQSSACTAAAETNPSGTQANATKATNDMTTALAAPISASTSEPVLLIKRNKDHPNAKIPIRGSALAAGYDLFASDDAVIPKRGRKVVQTGIHVAIPAGCYGRVAPRSGLATKHGIDVGAGVVDADYRGLLGVLLFNFNDEDFEIKAGDRIAQLVLERICLAEIQEVEDLDETARGSGGFGSTGGFGPGQKE